MGHRRGFPSPPAAKGPSERLVNQTPAMCCRQSEQEHRVMPQLDPMLSTFYRYWEACCGSRAVPRRSDIDPSDIRALLPNLQLVDVVDRGQRFRFRLVGTAIVTAYGDEMTGRFFDEIMPPDRLARALGYHRLVCETKRPVYVRAAYATFENGEIVARRIIAPLSNDSISVNMTIAVQSFDYSSPVHEAIVCGPS